MVVANLPVREEALKEDYQGDDGAFDDDDGDEWNGDETTWTEEQDEQEETNGKDENSAYLEFLNEEVRPEGIVSSLLMLVRCKSFPTSMETMRMTNWPRRAC